jgi:hypothetical protein
MQNKANLLYFHSKIKVCRKIKPKKLSSLSLPKGEAKSDVASCDLSLPKGDGGQSQIERQILHNFSAIAMSCHNKRVDEKRCPGYSIPFMEIKTPEFSGRLAVQGVHKKQ